MTDKEAILAEVIEYTTPARIAEDEFTTNEYRAMCPPPRPTRETIRNRLEMLVEKGMLESRIVLLKSKWVTVYRKVDGKW